MRCKNVDRVCGMVVGFALAMVMSTKADAQAETCETVMAAKTPTVTRVYKSDVVQNAVQLETAQLKKAQVQPDEKAGQIQLQGVADRAKTTPEARNVSLGDTLTVDGENLHTLFHKACAGRSVVLFLNDWPIGDVAPSPPANPVDGSLHFKLVNKHRGTEAAPDPWVPILGKPSLASVPVRVSVGFANGYAMQTTAGQPGALVYFQTLPIFGLFCWALIFLFMVITFVWLVRNSRLLRDRANTADGLGAYSLSRTQGAFWFFIVLAAYLFIGLVTGDFSNSVNSTALILLGIGAGTVLGAAAIDAQKDTDKAKKEQDVAIATIKTQIMDANSAAVTSKTNADKLTGEITTLTTDIEALPPGDAGRQTKEQEKQEAERKKLECEADRTRQLAVAANLQSQLEKLNGKSEGFFIDILSDANGISFHRFQIFAWTIVLGFIFVVAVYENLAMPIFNTTLMGLLGLSAATYLGLKIPEPMTPTK